MKIWIGSPIDIRNGQTAANALASVKHWESRNHLMLYRIIQQSPPSNKGQNKRDIYIDLDNETYFKAVMLDIEMIIEVHQDLAAVISTYQGKETALAAKPILTGFDIPGNEKLPTLHEACVHVIKKAHAGY